MTAELWRCSWFSELVMLRSGVYLVHSSLCIHDLAKDYRINVEAQYAQRFAIREIFPNLNHISKKALE